MMRIVRLTLLGTLCALPGIPVYAQPAMEAGARAAGMGGAATALYDDVWGLANPASWATLSGRVVAFFVTEAFGLPELRLGALQYAEPTRLGTFSTGVRSFGFEDFRDTRLNVGYAHGLRFGSARRFHAGVMLRYQRLSIPGYGSAGSFGFSAGGLVGVFSSLSLGFQATNLPALQPDEEPARTLALGVAFHFVEQLLILMDVYKDVRYPASLRMGVEVKGGKVLSIRAGATTQPTRFSAGLGLRAGRLFVNIAGENHEALGWSPALALGLHW